MTTHVYRFRREKPGALAWLENRVGSGLFFVDRAGGVVIDVQADDTQLGDLTEALAAEGLVYLSTDPTTLPTVDVEVDTAGVDNVLIDDLTECPIVDDVLGTLMVDL